MVGVIGGVESNWFYLTLSQPGTAACGPSIREYPPWANQCVFLEIAVFEGFGPRPPYCWASTWVAGWGERHHGRSGFDPMRGRVHSPTGRPRLADV